MRKIISFLLIAVLAAMLPVTALASGSNVTLVPSVSTVSPGETFTVTAVLQNEEKLSLATVVLLYNDDALELLGGNCCVKGTSIDSVIPEQKVGTLFLLNSKVLSGDLFVFNFRVKESASAGECEIGVTAAVGVTKGEYIDAAGTKIKIACKHTPSENWESNPEEHWNTCTICEEKVTVAEHRWGAENACDICGYKSVAGTEAPDESQPSAIGPQTPSTDESQNPATEPQNGSEDSATGPQTPPTDGSQDSVTEPQASTAPSPSQNTTGTEPEQDAANGTVGELEQNTDNNKSRDRTVFWLLIGAIAVVGCGFFVTLILYRKKNEQQNSDDSETTDTK